MATACQLYKDQFLCSICHDVFTEPVTLPCGHNFCKKCVDQRWLISTKCMCPYCKKIFFYRPELKVNLFIAKIAAEFAYSQYKSTIKRSTPQPAKTEEVLCDVCTSPKQRGHISCLICRSSYCEAHLKPHLNMCGLKKPQLMESPSVSTEHHKPVELFCRSNRLCVCVGHRIVPLQEVSEQQRLELHKTEADIQDKIKQRVKKVEELRHCVSVSNDAADREMSDGVRVFTALKEAVEKALERFISEITRKKTHTEQEAESLIQKLEQEISELEKRGAEAKQLLESDDPLQLVRKSSQLSPEPPTKDWTEVIICPSTHEGAVARALSELQQDFNKTSGSLFEAELKRVKTKQVKVSLNGAAASSQLRVNHADEQSENTDGDNKNSGLFVFGKESFSESFYFEAEVRGRVEWTLGVANMLVKGKEPLELNPQNGFWAISLKNKALHSSDNPEMTVFTNLRPEKVGVFVDYEEGIVSFFDVDAPALILSFTNFTFIDKLSPFYRSDHIWDGNSGPVVC